MPVARWRPRDRNVENLGITTDKHARAMGVSERIRPGTRVDHAPGDARGRAGPPQRRALSLHGGHRIIWTVPDTRKRSTPRGTSWRRARKRCRESERHVTRHSAGGWELEPRHMGYGHDRTSWQEGAANWKGGQQRGQYALTVQLTPSPHVQQALAGETKVVADFPDSLARPRVMG